jgi:hypothetical protein
MKMEREMETEGGGGTSVTGVQMAKTTKYFFMFCLQSLSFQMSCSLGWQEHECSQRRKIVNLSRDEKQCKEK